MQGRRFRWLALAIVGLAAATAAGWYQRARGRNSELLKAAIRQVDRGRTEAAIPLFDEVLRRDPSNSTALLYRGQISRDSGDSSAAARFWNRVPDSPPREGGTARFLEGTLFLEANRTRPAEAAFLKSIALHPDYLSPHERLLKLYVAQLRTADIRRELDAIRRFRLWTLEELYQLLNSTGEAVNKVQSIPRIEEFVAADPNDLDSLIALGRFYNWDNRHREAADVLRRALVEHPDNPAIRAYLAEALLGQLDLEGARRVLQGAPLGQDALQCVWKSHGLYWFLVDDWPRAIACLERAVALDPDDQNSVYKLGQAHERAGDLPAARIQFRRAESLLRLQSVMFRVIEREHNNPEMPIAKVREAGRILTDLNRHQVAVAFFEQVLTWIPESDEARRDLEQARQRAQAAQGERPIAVGAAADLGGLPSVPPSPNDSSLASNSIGKFPASSIRLVDRHHEAGIDFQYFNGKSGLKYLVETTGGGVGVLDFDADGWPDLYFPQGCRIPFQPADSTYTDRLYRNLGNDSFADVTHSTGLHDNQYSQGCAAGDYDNDGFTDLAVANFGTNAIYHNNGDGTFSDVTQASGIAGEHYSTSLGWGDLDRDGNLDLVVANYVRDPLRVCHSMAGALMTCHPQYFDADDAVLYLSRGNGAFDDATRVTQMVASGGRGLGVVIADLNDDGWPEVYIANDGTPCFLFQNLGSQDGRGLKFTEIGLASGTAVNSEGKATAAMGVACGDLDGDGRLDLYITNFSREADILYLNRGDLIFEDATLRAGLVAPTRPLLGWGVQALDLDLDGRLELFLTNGHLDDRHDEGIPWKMPSQLFYNAGEGAFTDISRDSGEFFALEHLGRGVARVDWNRDGRPDLAIVYQDRPAALLTNESRATGHRVILQLHGVQSNRDAIGARLRATCAGQTQILEICGGDGYCASNEKRQIFGIGTSTKLESLSVRWPSGRVDQWTDIPADTELILIEGQAPRTRNIDAK